MNDKNKCVYALLDQTTPEGEYYYNGYCFPHLPKYIGKGELDRPQSHFEEARIKKDKNEHKLNFIRKIFKETGEYPLVYIIKDNLDNEESLFLEIDLIGTIGRRIIKDGPLTNINPGGDDPPKLCGSDNFQFKVALCNKHRWTTNRNSNFNIKVKKPPTKTNSITLGWLHHLATKESLLGWYFKNEIETIFDMYPKVGNKALKTLCNENLRIFKLYGITFGDNVPYRVIQKIKNKHYWTDDTEKLWEEWKATYNPV